MIVEKLRDEILESQKARTDLIKWKLVLVAAIGAASLGFKGDPSRPVLLSLIPFVCLYVDAVCFHNDIRIMAIARFLRTSNLSGDSATMAYERYCSENRATFNLEAFALQGATIGLSCCVLLVGLFTHFGWLGASKTWLQGLGGLEWEVLVTAGGLGLVLGWLFYRLYHHKMSTLDGKSGWWLANRVKRISKRFRS